MLQGMEYVYEVYKAGSFSKAARNLFISQPALSTAIQKAEKNLGFKIFNRTTNPVTLTEVGMEYIDSIEKIMGIEQSLHDRINEINNLKYGHLNVGGANFFSSCMLPPIINIFTQTYPGITLEITEADSISLYKKAQQNHIDLIIDSGTYDEEHFIAHHLLKEQILLGIPASNPINERYQKYQLSYLDITCDKHLKEQECLDLSELADQRFILLNKGHDLHNRSLQICSGHGFMPENVLYLNQLMTAYNLAIHGIGIVFVTDTLIRLATHQNELIYYKINDPAACRDCFLAHRRIAAPTKSMEKFIEIARKVFPYHGAVS